MKLRPILLILALSLLTVSLAFAAVKIFTPATLEGGKIVTVKEVKKLVDQGKTAIFDMRKVINFGKGHLPGAISLPYKNKSEKVVDFDASLDKVDFTKFPGDKAKTLIFYSDGPKGWKSYKTAVQALRRGHTDVRWFRGGFSSWKQAGHPVE
jgi:rhodanese-related sulfurtransferase